MVLAADPAVAGSQRVSARFIRRFPSLAPPRHTSRLGNFWGVGDEAQERKPLLEKALHVLAWSRSPRFLANTSLGTARITPSAWLSSDSLARLLLFLQGSDLRAK